MLGAEPDMGRSWARSARASSLSFQESLEMSPSGASAQERGAQSAQPVSVYGGLLRNRLCLCHKEKTAFRGGVCSLSGQTTAPAPSASPRAAARGSAGSRCPGRACCALHPTRPAGVPQSSSGLVKRSAVPGATALQPACWETLCLGRPPAVSGSSCPQDGRIPPGRVGDTEVLSKEGSGPSPRGQLRVSRESRGHEGTDGRREGTR